MEKVKVTQGQANEINTLLESPFDHTADELLELHAKRGGLSTLVDLDINLPLLARFLYIGYEVEPEFKVGDYVVNFVGSIGEIKECDGGYFTGMWTHEIQGDQCVEEKHPVSMRVATKNIKRHASEREIKQVKKLERRMKWKTLPVGSLILYKRRLYEFEGYDEDERTFPVVAREYNTNELDRFFGNREFTLICHAEDRKDI